MLRTSRNAVARPSPSWASWLALFAFLAGWLTPQWHQAEAVHEWCAEHAAFEHAEVADTSEALGVDGSAPPSEPAGASTQGARLTGLLASGLEEEPHAEACAAFLMVRTQRCELTEPAALAAADEIVVPVQPGLQVLPPSVALLRQAPKTSPPVVG